MSRRFWKRAMKFRASTYPTLDARREEARGIYDAFLSVDSPDQASVFFPRLTLLDLPHALNPTPPIFSSSTIYLKLVWHVFLQL